MVKRYRMYHDPLGDCCCEMDERPNGDYVNAEDYDALAARLAEARWLLQEAREHLRGVYSARTLCNRIDALLAGDHPPG